MQHRRRLWRRLVLVGGWCSAVALQVMPAFAGDRCADLELGNAQAIHAALTAALTSVAPQQAANGGLGNHMWGTIVDQRGMLTR